MNNQRLRERQRRRDRRWWKKIPHFLEYILLRKKQTEVACEPEAGGEISQMNCKKNGHWFIRISEPFILLRSVIPFHIACFLRNPGPPWQTIPALLKMNHDLPQITERFYF